ncbi:MAG: cobalamin B12-binding domain-containing protein, partial [Micrococcales bacterium]|nr:cobalamin B12-binding domain-containing protein [Micrococcales bacterium]
VSFGAQGEPAATASLDEDAAAMLALSEASALLGIALRPEQLRAAHRARFVQSQPTSLIGSAERRAAARAAVARTGEDLGEKLRILVGKPGLDGHSNGAEQVAVRARDAGFEVVYQGIRLTPEQIVAAAVAEDVHVVGISILSGSHMELVPQILTGLGQAGADDIPVVVGGIIPESDAAALRAAGVAMVFTPKDFGLNEIMGQIVGVIRSSRGLAPLEAGAA